MGAILLQFLISDIWNKDHAVWMYDVQNFVKILFTDTLKTQRSGRQFVNKHTMLRYSLSTTE